MNPATTALVEEIAKDVVCAEMPTVLKYITSLESKVPQVGFKHFALVEVKDLLITIQNDLGCTQNSAT